MQPGEETTRCVVKRLDNREAVVVNAIHTKLAPGSHHLIVYRTDATEERTTPFACSPFADTLGGGSVPLMISEVSEETLTMPAGVGFRFEPNQMVRIEAHYLNYYHEPITAHADVDFHLAGEAELAAVADMLFYGTTRFLIPNDGTPYMTEWRYLDAPNDAKIFAMTGHTHQWGTNVEVYESEGADNPIRQLYPGQAPFVWSEAPIEKYDPPIVIEPGVGFRFRCTWVNNSPAPIGFGASANAEMCFFWAYYYPSDGYKICADGLLGFPCVSDG